MKAIQTITGIFLLGMSCSVFGSLDGSGSILVIPIVAQTASYTSQITVRNPTNTALPIAVYYAGGTGTISAGAKTCTPLSVPANSSIQFSVGSQCSLSAGASHFGRLTLSESSTTGYPVAFQAYSRTQTPGGNGFSVPAYPAGALESPVYGHYVMGLKRQAAAPVYQSNCFVAATDEPTSYSIRLLSSSGIQIGSTVAGNLVANQMLRFLDIFAAVGAPAGDYQNVTAEFSAPTGPATAFIGFCTVQESTFFGADFRMAQPTEPFDATRDRFALIPQGTGNFFNLASFFDMNRHEMTMRHPDRVRCQVVSVGNVLEIRLKSPTGAVMGGGTGLWDTGVMSIGPRSLYAGYSGAWFLDVAAMPSYFGPFPVLYFFSCRSGNGVYIPDTHATLPFDF